MKPRQLTKKDIGKRFIIDYDNIGILKIVDESGVYFDFKTSSYLRNDNGYIGFLICDKFSEAK